MAAQQQAGKQPVRGETLTSVEHTAIGALAGMIEACLLPAMQTTPTALVLAEQLQSCPERTAGVHLPANCWRQERPARGQACPNKPQAVVSGARGEVQG